MNKLPMTSLWPRNVLAVILLASILATNVYSVEGTAPISFRDHVAPILQTHCVACHGPKRAEGGYRIDTIEYMQKAGDSGDTPLVPSNSLASQILVRVCASDESIRMPAESEPLTKDSIELLKRWIDEGAHLEGIASNEPLWLVIPPTNYGPAPEHYAVPIPITALAFSDDGNQVLTSGYHEVLVWNALDGALAKRLGNQVQRIHSMTKLPNGNRLAIAGGTPGASGEVRVWNLDSGIVEQVVARSSDVVLDMALRPGKNEIAVGMADNTIRLIDLDSWNSRRTITSHADWVMQVAFNEDGSRIGSASRDKSAKVFDAESGDLLVSYPGHAAAVRGIAAVPGSTHWMTVGGDSKWHRWDVEGAKKIAEATVGNDPSKLLRSDQSVFVPSGDKHWYRIELSSNGVGLKQPGHADWILAIAHHPATSRIATGSMDGMVRLWNVTDGSLIRAWVAKP